MKKIALIGAYPASLINFRGDLIRTLVLSGHQVTAMAAPASQETIAKIHSLGADFRSFPIHRTGLNPWKDLQTFFSLRRIFRQEKPDVILAYTIKPVIWGGLAANYSSSSSQFYALISGLGFAFENQNIQRKLLRKTVSWLYHLALRKANRVIFQNQDDEKVFFSQNIIPENNSAVVNGTGVHLRRFRETKIKKNKPVFLLIARLLRAKGIREYICAARQIKKIYPHVMFNLIGPEDSSPNGIPIIELKQWHHEGVIQYLGETHDVRPFLTECSTYVLPSYYGEGIPRSILEAMAIGRPILTTDNVGCKETVVQGENGFLVPIRNTEALAERMIWFIEHPEEWERMGKRSREIAENKFDVRKINKELMAIMGLEQPNTKSAFY
ncbi:MAG: glycosyltransferase family 4 protein [Candidatus Electrothrix aestuarii]|uniref:Glycosyltransferase family 4 protein n=1 Tax=Candidatus Electrothrix aestuarii TaxID=3062594 RepID=A0AAU8LYY6_9BACT|nr:glycosyltransferase family 4 protein [Candidatus Electrothrix aestuarii]